MKILFIGGTGNISSSCVSLAVEKGYDVSVLTRGLTPDRVEGVRYLQADIGNVEQAKSVLKDQKWDVVANFIAFKPEDIERDFELFADKVDQYLFISSASAYQKPLLHPFVTESTPLANPYWDYSRDKIACEEKCNTLLREHSFPSTIVRPALTYAKVIPVALGSWDDYTIIDRIKKGKKVIIHGDGSSLWTVTHADDFAKGFVGLFGNHQSIGHAFHITSDEVLTWNQIYQYVADAAGAPLNAVHIPSDFIAKFDDFHTGNLLGDKAVSKVFDNSKIKQFVPGFEANIRFRDGIRGTVEWFEEKPERMKIVDGNNAFLDRVIEHYEKAFTSI